MATNLTTPLKYLHRIGSAAVACLLLLASNLLLFPKTAAAVQLPQRNLTISSPTAGVATTHAFSFLYASADPVASVQFEYCTSPFLDEPCDPPTGLNASGATLTAQTGEAGFTVLDISANRIVISRSAATAPVGGNPSTYTFTNVTNPTTQGTFYVRLTTYTSIDASGAWIDFGAVTNATTENILLNTEVPPILKFCVGLRLANDCTTADDNLVDLGDLTATRAGRGSSQMLAGTNAQFGLAIAAYGTTMTSGNNIIAALGAPTVSAPGNAQFGLNLRKNTDPNIGDEPSGVGIALPTAGYSTPNKYMFKSGDIVAMSPDATDIRKFTVSYIVNVPPSQVPGVYTATITYICSATF